MCTTSPPPGKNNNNDSVCTAQAMILVWYQYDQAVCRTGGAAIFTSIAGKWLLARMDAHVHDQVAFLGSAEAHHIQRPYILKCKMGTNVKNLITHRNGVTGAVTLWEHIIVPVRTLVAAKTLLFSCLGHRRNESLRRHRRPGTRCRALRRTRCSATDIVVFVGRQWSLAQLAI